MYPDRDAYDIPVRDRVFGQATASSEGRRAFIVVGLALCVFVFTVSLSCRQATSVGPATNVLASGIVTLTDLDQFLADQGPAIKEAAKDSPDIDLATLGYPLDIVLSADEVNGSSPDQLRELILDRSAALVYARGLDAFDRTGEQSLQRFSIQGVLQFGVDQISEANHRRAGWFLVASLVAGVVCAAVAAAMGTGWNRMRSLGMAAGAGAVPVIIIFFVLRLLAGQIGDGDPFIGAYRDITRSVLAVPLRNALIILAAGAAIVVGSIALERLERMLAPGPSASFEDS